MISVRIGCVNEQTIVYNVNKIEHGTCLLAYAPKLWPSRLLSWVWTPIWVANSGLSFNRHSQNDLKIFSTSADIVTLATNIERAKLWRVQIAKKRRGNSEEIKRTRRYFHAKKRKWTVVCLVTKEAVTRSQQSHLGYCIYSTRASDSFTQRDI